jgi:hypothetical protein
VILYRFTKDLKALYLKTGVGAIEELFVRCAQTYDQQVIDWLGKNPQIKGQLSNPEVYDALIFLAKMKKKFGSPVKAPQFYSYLVSNPEPAISTIMAFPSLIGEESVEPVLDPFRDIISLMTHLSGDARDPAEVLPDLQIISKKFQEKQETDVEGYWPVKRTKQQEKLRMFSTLLQRFTNDVSGAASRSGLDEFASFIREGGLAKPNILENHVPIQISPFMWKQAQSMVQYVLKNLGDLNLVPNYNFVKERAMDFVGLTNPQELVEMYNKREETMDLSKFMDPDDVDESVLMEDIVSITPSDADLLNPSLLSMLAAFFAAFYARLR